jgi:hypothetical protein
MMGLECQQKATDLSGKSGGGEGLDALEGKTGMEAEFHNLFYRVYG